MKELLTETELFSIFNQKKKWPTCGKIKAMNDFDTRKRRPAFDIEIGHHLICTIIDFAVIGHVP